MRALFRILCIFLLIGLHAEPSMAQPIREQASSNYAPDEIVTAGSRFFGGVSSGLARLVEHAVSQWGLPNGYILGQEAGGAFVGGVRYGKGVLTQDRLAIGLCTGKAPRLAGTSEAMAPRR